jgi:hypothetical protein
MNLEFYKNLQLKKINIYNVVNDFLKLNILKLIIKYFY